MEKSSEFQIMVYNENGELLMRLPGGFIQSYDNRFGDLSNLLCSHGKFEIYPLEE